MSNFENYYKSVLQHSTGFKLILGGTGLGKTHGILETVKNNSSSKMRFFYIANRLQLLEEMSTDLNKREIGHCFQKSDDDILKGIMEVDFTFLIDHPIIRKYEDRPSLKYKQNHREILSFFRLSHTLSKTRNSNHDTSYILDQISFCNANILNYFKEIISYAHKVKKNGKPEGKFNPNDYDKIIALEGVKRLFPYIEFINNPKEKRVFLVSLQKAFYGFFNGEQTINLYKLENSKVRKEQNVIFLDEFDFLESELLNQICKDSIIEKPFGFIELFYNRLTKNKFTFDKFLSKHQVLKDELNMVIKGIGELNERYNIDFPRINQFACVDESLLGTSIFQTRFSITNKAIYLDSNKRDNTFHLQLASDDNKANSYALLNTVNQSMSAIIRIFKSLETEDPSLYNEIIEHCFGTSDLYKKELRDVRQIPARRRAVGTNYGKLYINGFGLYEVAKLNYISDEEEAELKYYSLLSTPEGILLKLAKHNLVFGLSATAELDRLVKCFDLAWLKDELNEKQIRYYESTEADLKIITEANLEKSNVRQNKVKVEIANITPNQLLENIFESFAVSHPSILGQGITKVYREKRVKHFFSTLDWIAVNERTSNTNLLFFTSTKEIYDLISKESNPENNLFEANKIEGSLQKSWKINYKDNVYNLLFLDASEGKALVKFEENRIEYNKLFKSEIPFLLITTYSTASNGVNLHYDDGNEKMDFANIHLLDTPFYFFNPIDANDFERTKNEKIKANIYYLSKLEKRKVISQGQFKKHLNDIRNISYFNSDYIISADGRTSLIATYIQALGRIERVWSKMDNQVVRLEIEVYNRLEEFCTVDDGYYKQYKKMYNKNLPYFSFNVNEVFCQIALQKIEVREHSISEIQEESLFEKNMRCKESIAKLLDKISMLREGKLSKERSLEIRSEWKRLREMALKHNYAEQEDLPLLMKYNSLFKTDYFDSHQKAIWIESSSLKIVPISVNPDSRFTPWYVDNIYSKVRQYDLLITYFEHHEYELAFGSNGKFFTPYFYQAILSGAIGEEVVVAVFRKENILLVDEEIPDSLFEVVDKMVHGHHWFIDAKNYSEATISNFHLDESDPLYHPKLNESEFKKSAKRKITMIQNQFPTSNDCKLIYINAFGAEDRPVSYLDQDMNSVGIDFNKASVIIIQGILKKDETGGRNSNYTKAFSTFISEIKKSYQNEN